MCEVQVEAGEEGMDLAALLDALPFDCIELVLGRMDPEASPPRCSCCAAHLYLHIT